MFFYRFKQVYSIFYMPNFTILIFSLYRGNKKGKKIYDYCDISLSGAILFVIYLFVMSILLSPIKGFRLRF